MSEALLLSVIHKLETDENEPDENEANENETDDDEPNENEADEDENIDETDEDEDETDDEVQTYDGMERVIKEMREIVDIVRDKKLEEGRSLNFLVSDLVDMAGDALHISKRHRKYIWGYLEYASIHSWMGEIKKQMLKLGDDDESNIRSSETVEDDKYVVGLDEDVEFLIRKRMIGQGEDSNSILIKGMPGIGKTTLAREIYNHATVIQHFERRAWVSNSTHITIKELLIKLIQQVQDPQNLHTSSSLENMDNRSLRDMLRQHLLGKRYLIVLDDVPKQMCLKSFLNSFPREGNGSKLVFTSHTTHVNIFIPTENVYKMEPLDSKKSWQLFLKTINHGNKLVGEHKFPMSLEPEGKQMLRKCGGLPLAIKEVGKQLAKKKVSEGIEWEQLLESIDFGSTLKLLEPFYHQLHPEVQPWFLCIAFFKENKTLRKEKLIQICITAGAVQDSEYECEEKLEYLVNESVIDVNDKGTEYRVNVVLHMLSIQKAEEKLGFEILSNNGNNRPSESPRHHRVIICSRDKFNYSTDQDNILVSLFFHGGGYLDTSPSYWKSFEQRLRVLDLEDFGLKFLPESIGTLMELRYLGLRNNYIKELPESLGCLEKLEVLDIAQNFMVEVPDIIWELHSLRHLYMSNLICRKPLKIGTLENLETLTYVSVDNWTYELPGMQLTKISKLGIEEVDENSDVSKLFVSLAELKKLDHLILRGYRFRCMPCLDELGILESVRTLKLDGLLARLPRSFPPKLGSLTLVNSCLDEDPMPLLGKLPKLYDMKLQNAYTGQQMVILSNAFQNLKVLCIEELWNLRSVQIREHGMPWLEKLEIHDCPYLDTLPEENIVKMYYFKELKMVTTESIATKIRNSELISGIQIVNINPMS